MSVNELGENVEYDAYEIEELVRLYSVFERGIDEIDRVEKKFKRKKYNLTDENKEMIEMCRNHLQKRENEYYPYLIQLIQTNDEEEELFIREELTFFVHNSYGVMNTFLEWEFKIKDEQERGK